MEALQKAMVEIEAAKSDVSHGDTRTELESIAASIQEMIDTAADEPTDPDVAFGDTDFAGAAPRFDHLVELEQNLYELSENVDQDQVSTHLETAHRQVAEFRSEHEDREE